ncbi:MAG: hypothetical protein HBSAPP03_26720 [Phycisphaerae bacterium]|nr:MAG: hypothetical protein HBSAPP03_26720 [Phycisphaerae bacterium]
MPLAPGYFLTWHTYGTWLHGDDSGSVDADHNAYGSPRLAPDRPRLERELAQLKNPPVILSRTSRLLVDAIMREHCRIRNWNLRALAVRSNHVHVVIANPEVDPERIVKQLKEWGTRKLRSHRIVGPSDRVWADHASTIYLFEPGSLDAKVRYVLEMQDNPPEGHGRADWEQKYGMKEP